MSSDGIDEIIDERIAEKCNPVEARSLARIAHKCLRKIPNKRPSISEVSQGILQIQRRRLIKEDSSISLVGDEFSKTVNRIESQQLELSKLTSIAEHTN